MKTLMSKCDLTREQVYGVLYQSRERGKVRRNKEGYSVTDHGLKSLEINGKKKRERTLFDCVR